MFFVHSSNLFKMYTIFMLSEKLHLGVCEEVGLKAM